MAIRKRKDGQDLITTELSGRLTMADMLKLVFELGEMTGDSKEIWTIVLLDDDAIVVRDSRAKLTVIHHAKEILQFKARGAVAIVASQPRANRRCQRFAKLLRGDAVPVTVFPDESQARKWISVHMHQGQFDATTLRYHNRGGVISDTPS